MHDISADLPSPHEDEPPSLRQDIVDEIADHLECSLRREQLSLGLKLGKRRLPDSTTDLTVQQTVITRFGDPAAIARRLWLDAMKERLMAHRITTLVAIIAAVACIAACMFMWQLVGDSRDAQTALLNVQREQFAALLDRLPIGSGESGASSAESSAPEDTAWHTVRLKLVLGERGGPAVGFRTSYVGQEEGLVRTIDPQTDENGISVFGTNRFGNYAIAVMTPAGESAHVKVSVVPDSPAEHEIVCPLVGRTPIQMQFQLNHPDELQQKAVTYVLEVHVIPREIGGIKWRPESESSWRLFIDSKGIIAGYDPNSWDHGDEPKYHTSPDFRQYRYSMTSVTALTPQNGMSPSPARVTFRLPGEGLTFDPQPGPNNNWTLALPDSFWERVSQNALSRNARSVSRLSQR